MKKVKIEKLTNSSEETPIGGLLSGDTVFSIPYFQRPYKWRPDKLKKLNQDILNIVDGISDFHFLGAIIIHGRRSNPTDSNVYDVIDGQQRITTLYLYLAAIVKMLSNLDRIDEASGLFLRYLVNSKPTKLISNFRLHSCKEDRSQLNFVIQDVLSNAKLKKELEGIKIKSLPSTGPSTGKLRNNFNAFFRFLKSQLEQGGEERVTEIYHVVLQKISVVQIDVLDPTDGPKIFDSLNSRQEPMTIGDLVRNEIFSKVASEDPENVEIIDRDHWQPFYQKFKKYGDSVFDKYFFPYGLVHNSNLKKSEVYGHLQEEWKELKEPEAIIKELKEYQNDFIDITHGTNLCSHEKEIAHQILMLYKSGAPSSTYPFLMQVSKGIRSSEIAVKNGLDILKLIESFLIRRAICGIEPTGLHAVFKRLWKDCGSEFTSKRVRHQIEKHGTVQWPSNEDVIIAVKNRPLYKSSIANFLILQYDESLGGDKPNSIPWIEHILPDKPSKQWWNYFHKSEHENMKHLIANLIPLTQKMNQQLSNGSYEVKRSKYSEDSIFKSTRMLAKEYDSWTPKELDKRSEVISNWVVKRWPE